MKKNILQHLSAVAVTGIILASCNAQAQVGDIFYIDMENQNATQPDGNVAKIVGSSSTTGTVGSGVQQIYGNPAAPYINSLITPGNPNAADVSYAGAYHNVLATATGSQPSIHPSEPNYLWQESGSNFGIANDNDPYQSGNNVAVIGSYLTANPTVSGQNLTGLIQASGQSWTSYQEDTDLATTGNSTVNANQAAYNGTLGANQLTSSPVSAGQKTVPLSSFSGTSTNYTNPYNGSHQYNFAAKHDGQLFYADTNGGNNATTSNVEASHYAPLQQLTNDLTSGTVSKYNLITPDQYNDMHTALSAGLTYNSVHFTGEGAQIAQGDNFLSIVVPEIEASAAFQNNGEIVIWTDETEPDSTEGDQNTFANTLMEIVISPLAKGNAYDSTLNYTHSSDVATLQNQLGVSTNGTSTGYLNDAANLSNPSTGGGGQALTLSDLFQSGVIPTAIAVPEPSTYASLLGGLTVLALVALRRRARNA